MGTETILLVEDNEDDAFAFTWSLGKTLLGGSLRTVIDGRQAVAYLRGDGEFADREKHPLPCMVFLDLKLPYLSGHEVLEWIRLQPQYTDLAVVILSGSDEGRDHKRATENGANAYLIKPIRPECLSDTIKLFCGL